MHFQVIMCTIIIAEFKSWHNYLVRAFILCISTMSAKLFGVKSLSPRRDMVHLPC